MPEESNPLDKFLKKHKIKRPKTITSEETAFKDSCIAFLEQLEKQGEAIVWNKRWSGGIYQKAGFPDLEVWYRGKHFDIEFKDESDTSTLQDDKIARIEATGNIVRVVDSLREFKRIILEG